MAWPSRPLLAWLALVIVSLPLLPCLPSPLAANAPDVEVFTRRGCPHCASAKDFLADLQREHPSLRVVVRDVADDPRALASLEALASARQVTRLGVPAFFVREELIIGFRSPETTGARIRALLNAPCPEDQQACADQQTDGGSESIEPPLFGPLAVRDLGLPAFTLVIGLLDGFNPCAMWVLLFLLSLLVNLRDRRRMALVAGTFVVMSGLVYFAFMAAWLNVFLVLRFSRTVQLGLGLIAALIGAINIRDCFAYRRGISLGIPEAAKPRLNDRLRRVLQAERLSSMLLAVIVLALLVNLVELACTAGFPAAYTHILALQQLPRWQYYAYLGLYNAAYVLDDSIMVAIAVITLSHKRLTEREGRWLKLVSGVAMMVLGLMLIVVPQWLI